MDRMYVTDLNAALSSVSAKAARLLTQSNPQRLIQEINAEIVEINKILSSMSAVTPQLAGPHRERVQGVIKECKRMIEVAERSSLLGPWEQENDQ